MDVVIVGAGFAGVVAARELTTRGYGTVILEGRDRIGGRTLTRGWNGFLAELGGQWIHWTQPHVWAEVTRYGLPIHERAPVESAWWISQGRVHAGSVEDLHRVYADAWSELLAGAASVFPRPYEPLAARRELDALDGITVGQRLDRMKLEPEARDVVRALASVGFNAPCDDGALTQLMRRVALVGCHPDLLAQALATFKLTDGTRGLLDAILADADAAVELSTRVTRIDATGDGVTVHAGARRYRARAAIVTAPISTLGDIEFLPELSAGKRAMVTAGQMTRGAMLWLRLRNVPAQFLLMAPPEHRLTYVRSDAQLGDEIIANAFAPVAARVDMQDKRQLERDVRAWLPRADLVDVLVHDWTTDPFSQQTWTMLRPRQLSESFSALREPEGAVVFAGADYASGWLGFIDGAIESALAAARRVDALLAAPAVQA